MVRFGTLKRLDLRTLWPNEAHDFSPWLASNIDKLGEALGMELELAQREASVGDFSLDLLATDLGTGRPVIIENQLSATDHDHLGKLLTYAAGFDASAIIWIAESIREEHRQALEWLNQRTDSESQFFGIVIEALRIDDSQPAFNFRPVVYPNEWLKTQRRPRPRDVSTRAEAYRAYFQQLIDDLREKHRFTGARKGQPQSWYSFASGFSGITYGSSFAQGNRVRVEVYIDRGDLAKNKNLFDRLADDKQHIEQEYGELFEWERLDDRRASRIAVYRPGSIEDDREARQEILGWAIDHLLKIKKVFAGRLKEYYRTNP
jgi:hypothetical protein